MWWTDGSHSDDSHVGAAAVGKHRDEWRYHRSYWGPRQMDIFDAEQWAIRLVLKVTIKSREILQRSGVKTVAVFSDSQAAIWWMGHLVPGPGKQLARQINRREQARLVHGIKTEILWVLGPCGIHEIEGADRQVNIAHAVMRHKEIERLYSSASNMARQISEGMSAAKAKWEADKSSANCILVTGSLQECLRGCGVKT